MNQRVAGQLSLEEMPLRPHLSAWKGVRWGDSLSPEGTTFLRAALGRLWVVRRKIKVC